MQEPDTQSFVVKVWLEETVEEEGRAKWRGHVTHVTSGERRYLESLSGIADFIMPYLERWGVRFGALHRLRLFMLEKTGLAKRTKKSALKNRFL
jgi:hypothetical protein